MSGSWSRSAGASAIPRLSPNSENHYGSGKRVRRHTNPFSCTSSYPRPTSYERQPLPHRSRKRNPLQESQVLSDQTQFHVHRGCACVCYCMFPEAAVCPQVTHCNFRCDEQLEDTSNRCDSPAVEKMEEEENYDEQDISEILKIEKEDEDIDEILRMNTFSLDEEEQEEQRRDEAGATDVEDINTPGLSSDPSFNDTSDTATLAASSNNEKQVTLDPISLDDFSELILAQILSHLPLRDGIRSRRVCRVWKSILEDPTWVYEATWNKSFVYDVETETNLYCVGLYRDYFEVQPLGSSLVVQADIRPRMREVLVDWMSEVADSLRLVPSVLFFAVRYVDTFLGVCSITPANLQRLGATCLWIAAKLDCVFIPSVTQLTFLAANTFTEHQMREMEHKVLNVLGFKLYVPTVLSFEKQYLETLNQLSGLVTPQLETLSDFYAELSTTCFALQLEHPSDVAAAVVVLAFHTVNIPDTSSLAECLYSKYDDQKSSILRCIDLLCDHYNYATMSSPSPYVISKFIALSPVPPVKPLSS